VTATFWIGCVTSLLTSLVELDKPIGSTFMVVLCALATEFCGLVSIPPADMLQGFSSRLFLYSREIPGLVGVNRILTSITATVQEACVISMLRITADVDSVPAKTLEAVTKLGESSGRHIRRVRSLIHTVRTTSINFLQRCKQFLSMSGRKPTLLAILGRAHTQTVNFKLLHCNRWISYKLP
jgi:AP-4 complex subunit epsilon-1